MRLPLPPLRRRGELNGARDDVQPLQMLAGLGGGRAASAAAWAVVDLPADQLAAWA